MTISAPSVRDWLVSQIAMRCSVEANDPFEDCVYSIAWRLCDLPASGAAATRPPALAPWLVLCDARGTGAALAEALRARGEACLEIEAAHLADLPGLIPEACRGVVHCGSLDAAPWEETSPATLEADLRRGTLAAVMMAQATLRRALRDPQRLFLVTRGAQSVLRPIPVSGRDVSFSGIESMVGLFINYLPTRVRVDEVQDIWTWLRALQAEQVEAREHQHLSMDELKRYTRVPAESPLYRTLVVYENYPFDPTSPGGDDLAVTLGGGFASAHYPLTVGTMVGQGLEVIFGYQVAHFDPETIGRMAEDLTQLLRGMLGKPAPRLGELLTLLDGAGQRQTHPGRNG